MCVGCSPEEDKPTGPGALPADIRLSPRLDRATKPEEGSSRLQWYDLFAKGMTKAEITAARRCAQRHHDMSSYVPLMALWEHAPEVWVAVDAKARAKILCRALANVEVLNDLGVLDPCASYLSSAGVALVMTGPKAIPHLADLLTDSSPGRITGSKAAFHAMAYQWRRMDYAYYLIHRIAGRHVELAANPADRNGPIAALRRQIREGRFSVRWEEPPGSGPYKLGSSEPKGVSPKVLEAIRQGRAGVPLWRSHVYRDGLSRSQFEQAGKYVRGHADVSSYILLMTLRKHAPATYKQIGVQTRCRILASALGNVMYMDSFWDFDTLGPADCPAGAALVELGEAAVPHLTDQPWSNKPAFALHGTSRLSAEHLQYTRKVFAKELIRQIEEHRSIGEEKTEVSRVSGH